MKLPDKMPDFFKLKLGDVLVIAMLVMAAGSYREQLSNHERWIRNHELVSASEKKDLELQLADLERKDVLREKLRLLELQLSDVLTRLARIEERIR